MLEDVLEEYYYYCTAKGFTRKTMINKRQELKQIKQFLTEKRGITKLENVTVHDLKAYVRFKQKAGLKPQSVVSMWKMVAAFFNCCYREEYIKKEITSKVDMPKFPKLVLKGFDYSEVQKRVEKDVKPKENLPSNFLEVGEEIFSSNEDTKIIIVKRKNGSLEKMTEEDYYENK